MISRWNYLAITTVMLVVFFLFQFTNVALENWDGYEENSYYQERVHAEERKLIKMHMKSTLYFMTYYKILWGYRNFRKKLQKKRG